MISLASELLSEFIKEEAKKVEGFEMPHMPTLGEAYEEITKDGIDSNFAIPHSLDLRVVKGFVRIDGHLVRKQIDCMLVVGDGEKYARTSQYYYDIDQVLCIFEVKKTLSKADLWDAYDHVGEISRRFTDYFVKRVDEGFQPKIERARLTFAQITGKMAPETYSGIFKLSGDEAILFFTLVLEENAPVTIIHGYDGYRSEPGLRNAFADFLTERSKISGQGLGIASIPNLITSNEFCLVKANGFPFVAITQRNELVAVASSRYNSAKIILEVLWTKISGYFGVRMPYGEDLEVENLSPLLIATAVVEGDAGGWSCKFEEYPEKLLKRVESLDWKPEELDTAEMAAINIMFAKGGYLNIDKETEDYFMKFHKSKFSDILTNLKATRLFAVVNDHLRPVSPQTLVLTKEDETGYVGNDRNRMDNWCKKNGVPPNYINMLFIDEL
ncbi:DUF6602 domain-containing protein [Duganella sp. LjRoot269]|uniref:DUF6602 domain-containing protein n=1 Tax=Duganella sp. LjRoot269 TaxID=3342305 RepID=UPI003ECE8DBF